MRTVQTAHILTFDIEHWYESWRLRGLPYDTSLPDCDGPLLQKLLDLLDRHDASATFFFTGAFAREFPHLARECVLRGHEVASHSNDHRLLTAYDNMEAFRADLLESLNRIEAACGMRPMGFRAPKWSVNPANVRNILNTLVECGLAYDSSFFPGHFSGEINLLPRRIRVKSGELVEIPASGLELGSLVLPAGGAWFRAFPLMVTRGMFVQKERKGQPAVFYAHPYDLNPDAHCPANTPWKLRLIRRLGVKKAFGRLESLLGAFRMISVKSWLAANPGLPVQDFTIG